jgi:hypothetical protein
MGTKMAIKAKQNKTLIEARDVTCIFESRHSRLSISCDRLSSILNRVIQYFLPNHPKCGQNHFCQITQKMAQTFFCQITQKVAQTFLCQTTHNAVQTIFLSNHPKCCQNHSFKN